MGSFTNWSGLSPENTLSRYRDNFFNNSFRKSWEDDLALDRGEITAPAVNVKEERKGFTLEFAAPGFRKSDFDIQVKGRVLTISAEQKMDSQPGAGSQEKTTDRYTRREFFYHTFSRRFTLPENVEEKDITARYENGILLVHVPVISQPEETPHSQKIVVA